MPRNERIICMKYITKQKPARFLSSNSLLVFCFLLVILFLHFLIFHTNTPTGERNKTLLTHQLVLDSFAYTKTSTHSTDVVFFCSFTSKKASNKRNGERKINEKRQSKLRIHHVQCTLYARSTFTYYFRNQNLRCAYVSVCVCLDVFSVNIQLTANRKSWHDMAKKNARPVNQRANLLSSSHRTAFE